MSFLVDKIKWKMRISYMILFVTGLVGLSRCHQEIDINHQPIAERIAHHLTRNQKFMQQVKYWKDFQFDFSKVDASCIQMPKLKCFTALSKIINRPNMGKCIN